MKASLFRRPLMSGLLFGLALVLSACGGRRTVASSWPGISVAEGTVYVAYSQQIHAITLSSGIGRWKYPSEPDAGTLFFASPALTPDGVVVGSYSNTVYLVDSDGNERWTFDGPENRIIGAALVLDEAVYVPSADFRLYALGLKNGELRWSFDEAKGGLWSRPVTDGSGRIYFGSMDHKVYALDAADGTPVWSTPTELGGAIAGSPALSGGMLYVGSFDKKLQALDAGTGEVTWTVPTEAWVWSGPLVVNGTLYAGDLEGNIYVLNTADGSLRWKIQPAPGEAVRGTPALLDDTLFFGVRSGTLYAVSAEDGAPVWSQTVNGELLSNPVIAGDKVLVAVHSGDKLVYAFNAASGAEAWSYPPEE